MAKYLRVNVVEKDTKINFSLPIGVVSRLVRFGGDIANVFSNLDWKLRHKIHIEDYKVVADFIDALKDYPPFTLVEIEEKDTRVLIQLND